MRLSSRLAAVCVVVMILASGLAIRWLQRGYELAYGGLPIPAGALDELPTQMGPWTGRDVPIDERLIKRSKVDAYVHRMYTRAGDANGVLLHLAAGLKLRDLVPHRPEVCYPDSGWTMTRSENVELPLGVDDGGRLGCRLYSFNRGTLDRQSTIVLNYYVVDGEVCADVSLLRSRIQKLQREANCAAQVLISVEVGDQSPTAEEATIRDFAIASAREIHQLLERVSGRAAMPQTQEANR